MSSSIKPYFDINEDSPKDKEMTKLIKMNVYAAGGCATNICSQLLKYKDKQSQGFAEMSVYFIDTSRSNMSPLIPQDSIYLFDGLDGSGKLRRTNHQPIKEAVGDILHRMSPADINVVVSSGSGGSGSIAAPVIVEELVKRGEMVIVITVGSTSTRIETENTVKTLKSYELISRNNKTPVALAYRENSSTTPRGQVDSEVLEMIRLISLVFSGNNQALDTEDLRNFLNYPKVTSYTPRLACLDFFSGPIELSKGQALMSLVTLVDDKTSSDVDIPTEYQAVGFLPDATRDSLKSIPMPIHACIIGGYFNPIIDRLETKLSVFDDARRAVVEKSIVKGDEGSEGSIVL
jgi:hypothetical protein